MTIRPSPVAKTKRKSLAPFYKETMDITGELKLQLGKEHALLRFSESRTALSIDMLHVPASHRRQGIGASLINHMIKFAEGLGKDVLVSVRPIGSHTEERLQKLVKYYKKFGFTETGKGVSTVYMIRKNGNTES